MARGLLGFTLVFGLCFAACSASSDDSGGCASDRDCPADGQCQAGRCVEVADGGHEGESDDDAKSPLGSRADDDQGDDDLSDDDQDDDDLSDDDQGDDDLSDDDLVDDDLGDDDLGDDDTPGPVIIVGLADDDVSDDDAADDDAAKDAGADDDTPDAATCPDGCDDGIDCTVDRCQGGICQSDDSACECERALDCADSSLPSCARAACDAQRRCLISTMDCECEVDGDCTDGDPCTVLACVDGACAATVAVGASCDDGVACTGPDECQTDGSCEGDPAGCNPTAPAEWTCSDLYYGDDRCDCGCGAPDVDCPTSTAAACIVCNALGSCATTCADIEPTDNATCLGAPAEWTCDPDWFGDDECDCGCGAVDSDCASANASACDTCAVPGSCAEGRACEAIDPLDNSGCIPTPADWTCDQSFYGDGLCDCGCGALDFDCADGLASTCDFCNCSAAFDDCSLVNPSNNAKCDASWTCDPLAFADGATCDCGCGAFDPDCTSAAATACEACGTGSCADSSCGNVHPTVNALCGAPPEWTCAANTWTDGVCDCGCGAVDPDCASGASCARCGGAGSCAAPDCSDVDPDDSAACLEWGCADYLDGDGYCDCGCGAPDSDCASTAAAACEYCWCENFDCPATGSQRNFECLSQTDPGWTCTPAWYGDGYCDCGCGVVDPDCPDATAASCEYCISEGCSMGDCDNLDPINNAVCSAG